MLKPSRAALLAALLVIPVVPALAHATLETTQGQVGKAYKGVVRIGHGCEGSPTISLKILVPEGLIGVKPMPKAGWKLETITGLYAQPRTMYGEKLTTGVKEIVWSGGNLPDAFYDEFVFSSVIAADAPPENPLYVAMMQTCEKGAHNWVQIPAPGQDAHSLKEPAPFIRLTAAATAPVSIRLGDLVLTQPWARATPAGAPVAGGYIQIKNNGATADRLVSGSTSIAAGLDLHTMTTEDGVMKMRPLEEGLLIEPGASVELKPGGLHMMFTGLKQQLKKGESFKATLVFEKAGPVTLDFLVEAIGAQGVSAPDDHSGH